MVSSIGHAMGVLDPENVNGERNFGSVKLYGNSKLYNVSHTCNTVYVLYVWSPCVRVYTVNAEIFGD